METFEVLAEKKRREWKKRTILISFGSILLSGGAVFLIWLGLAFLSVKQHHQLDDYYHRQTTIAFPNMQRDHIRVTSANPFGGNYEANLIKDVDGISVKYEEIEANFSVMKWKPDFLATFVRPASVEQDSTEIAYSYKSHQKAALFFNPKANYNPEAIIRKPAQELPYLAQMKGQLVEVAISFDKQYTLAELEEKLPKNLKANWYWIGSASNLDSTHQAISHLFGWTPRKQWLEPSYQEFYELLEEFSRSTEFKEMGQEELVEDVRVHLASEGELGKATFGGVILTGKAEDFAQLENQDWIFASSIGVAIPNQPYYQLDAG
ncbi:MULTISPECIES: anti sigma factor C-terminal domain-containing protein [unclassified Streptococcus]|nr:MULTISPECIES: anti sigma factor C-terminal domain-containing protein [unclassified Streptococcus]MBF0787640.1 anti sigma factor C-terminal domain-containing protein [Streptococcus sp. 19428wC2_LYSM12]MCQ9212213.1 anti-sigma factor [Streptococcus sp. B01]MCQ9213543.1 anti-sigma factor [Streptococcus sp. O1]